MVGLNEQRGHLVDVLARSLLLICSVMEGSDFGLILDVELECVRSRLWSRLSRVGVLRIFSEVVR